MKKLFIFLFSVLSFVSIKDQIPTKPFFIIIDNSEGVKKNREQKGAV